MSQEANTPSTNPDSKQPEGGRRRKKKTRWGEALPGSRRKKSRWGSHKDKMILPPGAAFATKDLTLQQVDIYLFRLKLEQINTKLMNPAAFIESADLGPSPPPIYSADGQRVNTRDKRFKDKLMEERQTLLEKAIAENPALKAFAPGFAPAKKIKKIDIPVDKYPDYNFIGLIIGPRGNTQKRMERETGCKISIRGKGSSKKGRSQPDEDQPLHVHIIAPDEEKLAKAEAMINKLLIPMDETQNVHKAKQLRELALINGTLREVPKCRICGEEGHKIQECPKRVSSWSAADVKCAICGLDTHPTIDCPNKGNATRLPALNDEYASFMAELGGGPPPSAPAPKPTGSIAPAKPASAADVSGRSSGGGAAKLPPNHPANQPQRQQQPLMPSSRPPPNHMGGAGMPPSGFGRGGYHPMQNMQPPPAYPGFPPPPMYPYPPPYGMGGYGYHQYPPPQHQGGPPQHHQHRPPPPLPSHHQQRAPPAPLPSRPNPAYPPPPPPG